MSYPRNRKLGQLSELLVEYGKLMHEYGATAHEDILHETETALKNAIERIQTVPICENLRANEPNSLLGIRELRTDGPRRIWKKIGASYGEKLEGALLARMAGCTLGAIVEGNSIKYMEDWAKYLNFSFPPTDYWPQARNPADFRYGVCRNEDYTSRKMDGVPADDDITYTMLGLLIVEDYGLDFTVNDVGKAWIKYLPLACTAEEIALKNLKAGIEAINAAEIGNPYCQWIGADIRSDPWAYLAPAWPQRAAELAYRDAYLSHRRNGIYGEMFFSAAQSAAFVTDNAVDALKIGLTEIPKQCTLYGDIVWALKESKNIHNYKEARAAVDERFAGMSHGHTNNNAALTVFGLTIGDGDVTKTLSETVAMGMDNDCTAATAGSIVGAIVGKKGVPEHWYKPFNNKIHTYIKGAELMKIDDVLKRFTVLAEMNHASR